MLLGYKELFGDYLLLKQGSTIKHIHAKKTRLRVKSYAPCSVNEESGWRCSGVIVRQVLQTFDLTKIDCEIRKLVVFP